MGQPYRNKYRRDAIFLGISVCRTWMFADSRSQVRATISRKRFTRRVPWNRKPWVPFRSPFLFLFILSVLTLSSPFRTYPRPRPWYYVPKSARGKRPVARTRARLNPRKSQDPASEAPTAHTIFVIVRPRSNVYGRFSTSSSVLSY